MVLRSHLGCGEEVPATSWRLRSTTALEICTGLGNGAQPNIYLGMMGTTRQGGGCSGPGWGISMDEHQILVLTQYGHTKKQFKTKLNKLQ